MWGALEVITQGSSVQVLGPRGVAAPHPYCTRTPTQKGIGTCSRPHIWQERGEASSLDLCL